jgi:hypothetical protein
MRILTLLMILLMGVGVAVADHKYGKQIRYAGSHPIPKSEGGGMCYIEGPHVHIYAANKLEYRMHGDDEVFVGDPVAHGWDGPKYAYKGPHPIHVEAYAGGDPDEEYCYIEGPHYHEFAPPEGPEFRMVGDAYFYVGEPPHAMIEARPTYVGINAYYQPLVYTRPVVEVDAPVGWIGGRAEVWGPGVVVETPGVMVVGKHGRAVVGGGAVVEGGIGVVVPTPSVHVGVDIGIGGGVVGGGVVRTGPAPVIIEKHDNGRHEGWHKGHR